MPRVDRECTTHHACECLQEKVRQYDALLAKLRDREAVGQFLAGMDGYVKWELVEQPVREFYYANADFLLAYLLPGGVE